ncbi:hypothetical protein BC830DRAFT_1053600, partial [Chytriomyces sp. MP71]
QEPFQCPTCPKQFKRKHHLKSHLVSHERTKPFSCGMCGCAFKRIGELKKHGIVH